jgi:hypothetical protein
VEAKLHTFLTSALDGGRVVSFIPSSGKEPLVTTGQDVGWAPQSECGGKEEKNIPGCPAYSLVTILTELARLHSMKVKR